MKRRIDNLTLIDLETLGTRPGSVILQLGAARLTADGKEETWYRRIDPVSCQNAGLTMDVSTVIWWMGQGFGAQHDVLAHDVERVSIQTALEEFSAWYRKGDEVWGMATFDVPQLIEAYRIVFAGTRQGPWTNHQSHRCYRTLREVFPGHRPAPVQPAHSGLSDAIYELRHVANIYAYLEAQNV
jgi:hypothetical protein